jgi:hypothetical protein
MGERRLDPGVIHHPTYAQTDYLLHPEPHNSIESITVNSILDKIAMYINQKWKLS